KIPMRVRSTYSMEPGTLVTASRLEETEMDDTGQLMTGIAHLSDITQVQVEIKEEAYLHQPQVFKAMAEAGISVDFINISPTKVVYTIPHILTEKAVQILESLEYEPEITRNCAKVSAVGAGMTGVPGVASKIVGALTNEGVQILQSADSHTTIWVLIHGKDLKVAVNALHHVFGLDSD